MRTTYTPLVYVTVVLYRNIRNEILRFTRSVLESGCGRIKEVNLYKVYRCREILRFILVQRDPLLTEIRRLVVSVGIQEKKVGGRQVPVT